MGSYAHTKIIEISKDTFEAWKKGEKKIKEFNSCSNETYREEDFIDSKTVCKDLVDASESQEYPNSEYLCKRLDTVNSPEIKRDLLYVIHKYKLAEDWRNGCSSSGGSYVLFLEYYTRLSEFGIPRKYAKEEYVDPEEWEFMKDADEYTIVRQNPYMEVEDDGKFIRITVWG